MEHHTGSIDAEYSPHVHNAGSKEALLFACGNLPVSSNSDALALAMSCLRRSQSLTPSLLEDSEHVFKNIYA